MTVSRTGTMQRWMWLAQESTLTCKVTHCLKSTLPQKKSPTIVELLVEIVGVEPTTPCLQSRCSSQLSYTPVWIADANMALIFEMCNFYSRICIKSYKVISRKYVCLYLWGASQTLFTYIDIPHLGWAFSPHPVSRISFVYKDWHFRIDVSNNLMCCFFLFVWCGG